MYARAYVCACLYMYIHVYKDDTRVCMHVHTVCLYVCVYVRVDMIILAKKCMCAYVGGSLYININLCVCVYMHVYAQQCIYPCDHVYMICPHVYVCTYVYLIMYV